jgi:hypothetical protein
MLNQGTIYASLVQHHFVRAHLLDAPGNAVAMKGSHRR